MTGDFRNTIIWSVLVFLSKVSKGISTLLIAIVLGRLFGAQASGEYFLALTVVLVVSQIALLGFHQGVLKFVPEYESRHALHALPVFLRRVLLITGIVSILFVMLLYTQSDVIASAVFSKPEISNILAYLAFSLIGMSLFRVFVTYLQARSDMRGVVIYENLLLPILLFSGILIVSLSGWRVDTYAILTSVAYVGIMILLAVKVAASVDRNHTALVNYEVSASTLLNYSLPLMAAGLIQQLVFWSDTLMLGVFMESSDVGVYNAGMRIALATTVLLYVCNTVLVPSISRFSAEQNWDALKRQYDAVVYYLALMALPTTVAIVSFSDVLLGLFGDEFRSASSVLAILMLGQLVNIMTGSAGYILMMCGRERLEALNITATLVLNICLNLVLIPRFGINGAAIATSTSLIIVNLARAYQNRSLVGLPWFGRDILILMIITAVGLITLSLVDGLLKSISAVVLCLLLLVAGIVMRRSQLLGLFGR